MEGYDPNKDDMEESNYELWTIWDTAEALYDRIGISIRQIEKRMV